MEIRNKKPLSDITNAYNLIPTSALQKLVSSSNPNLKRPVSILNPKSSFRGRKVCDNLSSSLNGVDTRSDTSIGSSNVNNADALSSRNERFQNPKSPASSVNNNGDTGSKVAYNPTHTTDKFKNRNASAMTHILTHIDKKKDKGKGIAVSFSSSPLWKTNYNENGIEKLCCSIEKTKEIGMENLSPFGFRKGILNPSSCLHEKTAIENALLNYSDCSKERIEEIGKGNTNYPNHSFDQRKAKEKVILELGGSSIQKTESAGSATQNSIGFVVEKTNKKFESLNQSLYSGDAMRGKGNAILSPPDMVEGSPAADLVSCLPARRKNVKRKKDAGASSCPPRRTQKILDDFVGDVKSSKSWTAARPKLKKKQFPRPKSGDESCLPLDFIEQQRAYFKEVDEFELVEEEISQDDSE